MVFKKKVPQEKVTPTKEVVSEVDGNNLKITLEPSDDKVLESPEKQVKVLKECAKYFFSETEMASYNTLNQKIEDRILNIIIPFIMKFVFKIEKGIIFNYKLVSLKNVRIHLKDYLKETCRKNGDLTIIVPLEIFCDPNNDVLYNYLKVKSNYTIN